MKAVILEKAMSLERVARTPGDREREKNRKATPEINGSSFVPPYVIPTPNPIPVRHPRARMRISRLITFASHGTAVRQQVVRRHDAAVRLCGLVIVGKYKIGKVYRENFSPHSFVSVLFLENILV